MYFAEKTVWSPPGLVSLNRLSGGCGPTPRRQAGVRGLIVLPPHGVWVTEATPVSRSSMLMQSSMSKVSSSCQKVSGSCQRLAVHGEG